MQIDLPSGTAWHIEDPARKLTLRGQLPGARVFDLAAASLRAAKKRGLGPRDRFTLALPASWLVNSPAISRVLRRWALEPHLETCLAMIELLETPPDEWGREDEPQGAERAMTLAIASLGQEPYVTEALSKVLALVVPQAVPLMPAAARSFVLGREAGDAQGAFARMVEWFARAAAAHASELAEVAREHAEVELTAAGVLDRLLWFDSEGHQHFAKSEATPRSAPAPDRG